MASARRRTPLALALVAFSLISTATAARADCTSRANYGGGIVFATDREPLAGDRIFGGERARVGATDGDLTTGTLLAPDPHDTRGCTSRLAFFQALNHRFVRGHGRRALVYVHGYYTSFVTAARDALALRAALKFPGPVILYSWPATVTAKPAYGLESRNAAWSAPHFRAFVADLETHFHDMSLSFVARGVGARFATAGLRVVRDPHCHRCFGRAIFVEPEIARDLLHRRLADVRLCDVRRDPRRSAAPITIYSGTRRPSECAGIDTVRIPDTVVADRDPLATPAIASDVRGALAGTPVAMRALHRSRDAVARRRRHDVARRR